MQFGIQMNNNLFYEFQINELRRQLNDEKNKNQWLLQQNIQLNNKINNLQAEINGYTNKILSLENQIKNYKSHYNNFYNQESRTINVLKPGEKIMTVNFASMGGQDVGHYSLPCKNTDIFVRLEEKLNNDFPELKDLEYNLLVNTRKIKRFKTLEENKIKSNDVINIFFNEE